MVTAKEEKELFVYGHEGTTPLELLLVCSVVPIGFWCHSILLIRFPRLHVRPLSVEAATTWIPMIICQSQWLYPWGVTYLIAVCLACAALELFHKPRIPSTTTPTQPPDPFGYLTVYRSGMMYLTFVAILAVDFSLFPRRFAKTETRGYGLMDLGAASFVLAAGLVSRRAKKREITSSFGTFHRKTWRRMLPLVGMGMLRLVTHKGIDYQEHASEYGVHWNFFFTLAVIPLLTSLIPGPTWSVPIIVLAAYQTFLSRAGGQEWIETSPRRCESTSASFFCDLMVANREGILGCIGYASLYMLSEWIGSVTIWKSRDDSQTKNNIGTLRLWTIWAVAVALWQVLTQIVGIPVSRRSTNASFCLWALVVNLPLLAAVRIIFERHGQVSSVAQAVNRHGLICFVVANLLTGIINLSIGNTMQVSNVTAMVILLAYMTAIGVLAFLLEFVSLSRGGADRETTSLKLEKTD